jgi:hypothetical protein
LEKAPHKGKRNLWTLREFGGKTLWDWMGLLIVPVVLSLITVVFAWQQDIRQDQIESKRAKAERELAKERAQDEALQAYLSQMSTLILEKDLRHAEAGDEILVVARARTQAALRRLDPGRKTALMQFITEAGLVQGSINEHKGRKAFEGVPVISLSGADLSGTDLREIGSFGGSIGGEVGGPSYYTGGGGLSDLSGADLSSADLSGADLRWAFLQYANLELADLRNANLRNADLSDTNFIAADLSGADLSTAHLSGASLINADLSHADLSNAHKITNEKLEQQAKSLEGATMPDGQKYEDWLKSNGKREK